MQKVEKKKHMYEYLCKGSYQFIIWEFGWIFSINLRWRDGFMFLLHACRQVTEGQHEERIRVLEEKGLDALVELMMED
ncbi:hypothetical protein LCGC14_2678760 [marine sediment metagenome]|uniref:Uncharacterized protein n=1 Tax=marine sediment metagenome TaxID=412755 RepID=A0A0F9A9J8_9ZZZZ